MMHRIFKFMVPKLALILLGATVLSAVRAGEVGTYPNASPLTGSERFLADQSSNTVNVTGTQIYSWLFPNGYLPSTLMPSLTGDCTTTSGSFSITCTKSNGVSFSTLATAPTATAVVGLFSGCTGTYYLGADGNCHAPPTSSGGTVTSIGLTLPSYLSVTPSTITTSGTFTVTGTSLSANYVLATPNGSPGAVSARALVPADIPPAVLSSTANGGVSGILGAVNGGSGEAGTITGLVKANGSAAHTAAAYTDVTNLWSGSCSSSTYLNGAGSCSAPTSGSVTSVGLSAPAVFSVGGTPVTGSGTLALSFASGQTANEFLATPNGSTGAVALRTIASGDLPLINLASPAAGGVTGVLPAASGGSGEAGTLTGIVYANGTAAHTAATAANVVSLFSGTCTSSTYLSGSGGCSAPSYSGAQGLFLATPTASSGTATLRSIVAGDLPAISLTGGVSGLLPVTSGGTGEAGTVTGILYGNGTSPHTAATSSNVISLFTGTCNSGTFLNGAGACAAPTGGGSVTSVGLSFNSSASWLSVSGSPITGSGSFNISSVSSPAGQVLATPAGSAGTLSVRSLVYTDLPLIPLATGVSGTLQAANFPTLTGDVSNTGLATTVGKVNGATIPASSSVLASNSSSQITAASVTGSGAVVLASAPTLSNPALGNATATSVTVGSPTGGACGTGCINATGIEVNGTSLSTPPGTSSQFITITGSQTLTATACSVLVNAASGNITVTLPSAVGATANCIVKRIDNSAYTVTVNTQSSQTIDGAASNTIQYQYTAVSFKSDNANWWVF